MLHLKKSVNVIWKLKNKSCIEAAIHKSVSVKNSLFSKCIKLKDPVKKTKTRDKYKYYRNLLSTVIKKSKTKVIINSLKTTWIIWKILEKESGIW